MNILISGANSAIGRALIDVLKRDNVIYKIYRSRASIDDKFTYIVDLCKEFDENTFLKFLNGNKIDIIIHLASIVANPNNNLHLDILKKNILITENMIKIIEITNPKVFINFSSSSVYPNVKGVFSEKSLVEPEKNSDCIYGLSKYCSEVLYNFFFKNNKELVLLNLRISQVLGEGMQKNRIFNVMKKELDNKNTITVFGDGYRESCFIYISELVNIITKIIHSKKSALYNVGRHNISYQSLANEIINLFGNKESKIIKKQEGNREKFNLNFSKINSELNSK